MRELAEVARGRAPGRRVNIRPGRKPPGVQTQGILTVNYGVGDDDISPEAMHNFIA